MTEETAQPDRVEVTLQNGGRLGVHVQARLLAPDGPPHAYTVGAGDLLDASWPVQGEYDVHLHGPNGFFRRYAGTAGQAAVTLAISRLGRTTRLRVRVDGPKATEVRLVDAYGGDYRVRGGGSVEVDAARSAGWYDLTATVAGSSWVRVAAGHLETGHASSSDPALGR
jgi:phospholipase C